MTMNIGEVIALIKAFGGSGGGSSGGGVLVVNMDTATGTLDKTWQEIHDALAQGIPCVILYAEDGYVEQDLIVSVMASAGYYSVIALTAHGTTPFAGKLTAASADGYPAYSE